MGTAQRRQALERMAHEGCRTLHRDPGGTFENTAGAFRYAKKEEQVKKIDRYTAISMIIFDALILMVVVLSYIQHNRTLAYLVGMATVNMKDGLVKLLRGDSVSKGVNVTIGENNSIAIDFHIIVAYGVSISTVAENLMSTVRYKVEEFTGMQVEEINVFVEGVRVID